MKTMAMSGVILLALLAMRPAWGAPIYGCRKNSNGRITKIGTIAPLCNPTQTLVSWDQGSVTQINTGSGLQGGPISETGTIAVDAPTCGINEGLTWDGSVFQCRSVGGGGGGDGSGTFYLGIMADTCKFVHGGAPGGTTCGDSGTHRVNGS